MPICRAMCARYFIEQPPDSYRRAYGYAERPDFPPRFNVAPTQPAAIVLRDRGRRAFRLVRWGFWPAWLKDPAGFPLVFNIRSETAADKASFRGALRHRRCVFLADGFYEWRREGSGRAAVRTPFAIRRGDAAPMALAGLWETWSGADGSEIDTAAILTCAPNGTLAAIHDRMPVILAPEAVAPWLDVDAVAPRAAAALCRPCPDAWLRLDAVSRRVNAVAADDAGLAEPIAKPIAEPIAEPAPRRAHETDPNGQGRLL